VTKNNKTPKGSDLQDKIRDAQVKNILEKLKSGKTLTARESVIIGEYAAEKDNNGKKLTQRDIAKAWGMTQPNVHKMVKQGMPMDSMEAAAEWRKDFLEGRGRGSDAPASLNDARLRKTLLECERIELALAVDRGEYSKNTEVKESGIKIGSIFTAKLSALVNDASGALAGLDEANLKKKLHERVQAILAEIKTELEKV
jgi:hypothetical protein